MSENKELKQAVCLAGAGLALQMLGSACLILATVLTVKQANERIRQLLVEKLSK